jgi:hypothetical protein
LTTYGPYYLTKEEITQRSTRILGDYYKFLAKRAFVFRDKEFWNYHSSRFAEFGRSLSYVRLAAGIFLQALDLLLNPKWTVEAVLKRISTFVRTPGGGGGFKYQAVPGDVEMQ